MTVRRTRGVARAHSAGTGWDGMEHRLILLILWGRRRKVEGRNLILLKSRRRKGEKTNSKD